MREAHLQRLESDRRYELHTRRAHARGAHIVLNLGDNLTVDDALAALEFYPWDEVVYPSRNGDADHALRWAFNERMNNAVSERSRILVPQGETVNALMVCLSRMEGTFPKASIGLQARLERMDYRGRIWFAKQMNRETRIHMMGIDRKPKQEIRTMLNRARSLSTYAPFSYAQSGLTMWSEDQPASFNETLRAPEELVLNNIRMLLRWANGTY